ncbi:hypothetical protein C8R44DRAFT_746436 [Mycena epipterygia]|nr:hypothetical protein C8R44DRAFT_746436 [Mycena epipterygia]
MHDVLLLRAPSRRLPLFPPIPALRHIPPTTAQRARLRYPFLRPRRQIRDVILGPNLDPRHISHLVHRMAMSFPHANDLVYLVSFGFHLARSSWAGSRAHLAPWTLSSIPRAVNATVNATSANPVEYNHNRPPRNASCASRFHADGVLSANFVTQLRCRATLLYHRIPAAIAKQRAASLEHATLPPHSTLGCMQIESGRIHSGSILSVYQCDQRSCRTIHSLVYMDINAIVDDEWINMFELRESLRKWSFNTIPLDSISLLN